MERYRVPWLSPQMDVDEEEDEEDEDEEEEIHFSSQDLLKIRDGVVLLLQCLLRLLQTFPLKDQQQSTSNCTLVSCATSAFRCICLLVFPLTLGLFVPQLFSKMLYFEPVVGELTFATER